MALTIIDAGAIFCPAATLATLATIDHVINVCSTTVVEIITHTHTPAHSNNYLIVVVEREEFCVRKFICAMCATY